MFQRYGEMSYQNPQLTGGFRLIGASYEEKFPHNDNSLLSAERQYQIFV